MTDNIHRLRVAKKVTPVEEIRAEVVALLERTLAEAKRGEIDEIVILAKCGPVRGVGETDDCEWIERATATLHMRAWLGALVVLLSDWTEHYRGYRDQDD